MNNTQTQSASTARIQKYIPLIELILAVALVVGLTLTSKNIDKAITIVALIGLAVTFFLRAYKPADSDPNEAPFGFMQLLGYMIIPKVLWISCAVMTMGIVFYFSQMKGIEEMLMIGGLTAFFSFMLLIFIAFTDGKVLRASFDILLRTIIVAAATIYIFLKM
jgi:hypothetical protein